MKMKRQTNPVQTQQYWSKLVAEYKKSGLSVSSFAKSKGIAGSSFAYHVTKSNKVKPKKDKAPNGHKVEFIDLTGNETDFMEVSAKGVTLTLPINISPMTLRSFIEVLKNES